ncbi:MAG: IS1182 family transposase [Bryobacteraceae bacterium]
MSKRFRECSLEQPYLLPPSLQDWLPDDHLARFVADVVHSLDLRAILAVYDRKDGRGLAAYHPEMLTRLLLYAYAMGRTSSRAIERATYDDVAFRYLAADRHPDHDTIATFRRAHLDALANLFFEVLRLCQRAGLVKLGHVAIDGTKIKANASASRSMRYQKIREEEQRLLQTVSKLLAEAERVDEEEDAKFGKGEREHALPPELRTAASRIERLRKAQRELEEEAAEQAEQARREAEPYARRVGRPRKTDPPPELDAAQRRVLYNRAKRLRLRAAQPERHYNFTDPGSRMMWDNGIKSRVQGYNAQLAVDSAAQIVVAADVTGHTTDHYQLVPMVEQVRATMGAMPECVTADAGYWHTQHLLDARLAGTNLLVPPEGIKKGRRLTSALATTMRAKLGEAANRALYKLRSTTVEPVIGHIKEARGIRRFRLRGLAGVRGEWSLICATHNLLKLFRHQNGLLPA